MALLDCYHSSTGSTNTILISKFLQCAKNRSHSSFRRLVIIERWAFSFKILVCDSMAMAKCWGQFQHRSEKDEILAHKLKLSCKVEVIVAFCILC